MSEPTSEFVNFADKERLSREEVTLAMGEVSVHETAETTMDIPELSVERQAFLVERDPSKKYGFFCGDDRGLTVESAQAMQEQYGISGEDFIRYYGALTGATRILAVSVAAQYGAETLAQYGTSFKDLTAETKKRIESTNQVIAGEHSAEGNEGNPVSLNMDSEKGLGCAYCAGVGTVTGLCDGNVEVEGLSDLVHDEEARLFGQDMTDMIASANLDVEHQFFAEEGTSASVSREEIVELGTPVAILAGPHASASQVEVNLNFDPFKISQPGKATEAGVPFYNNDVTYVAEMLIKAYPELRLNPEIVLAAMVYDVAAVREALGSHDGVHAKDMKLVRNGSAKEAIEYLSALQAA